MAIGSQVTTPPIPHGTTNEKLIEEHANGPAPVDTIAEEQLEIAGLRAEIEELCAQPSSEETDTEIARLRMAISEIERRPPFWIVAIYLCDRAYGGPEEGGWYYDCGERQDQPIEGLAPSLLAFIAHSENAAHRFAEIVQEKLDAGINVGRRPISSVLSEGRYHAEVHRGYPPKHYPETRPHYE